MKPRTALVAGGVIALLVGALAGYIYGIDSTPKETTTELSTTTVSTTGSTYDQVADSFANHILLLSERNATALASLYAENATVTWNGAGNNDVGGLAGLYNGTDILLLMRVSFIGRGGSFAIGNVTRAVSAVTADSATVDSTFEIYGQDYNFGMPIGGYATSFNGTVSAYDSYVYSEPTGSWLISNETWSFTTFNIQY